MRTRLRLLLAAMLIAGLANGLVAYAQGHGHVPQGIPPQSIPPHGIPPWAGIPPAHALGPPAHAAFGQERAAFGQERAAIGRQRAALAHEQKLSRQQTDRAQSIARRAPQDYELDRNGALAIRGEVLVSGLDAAGLARIEQAGFAVARRNEAPELGISFIVVTHQGLSAARALERLRRIDPDGAYDLNHIFFESGARRAELHPPSTSAPTSRRRAAGATMVGLIDTGVAGIIESSPRIHVRRRNFAPTGSATGAHGTAVATLLARAPGNVTIYAADIFGSGPRGGTTELLVRALAWMAGEHVPVINISMVGPSNRLLGSAVQTMIGRGFTIVAPVGNDGAAAKLLFPASYPGVIAVSAVNAQGQLLPEASRVKRVDFVAPGIATVPDPSGRPTIVRGTSFASPIISREIADLVHLPDSDAAREALARLSSSAVRPKSDEKWFGHGMIGVAAAR